MPSAQFTPGTAQQYVSSSSLVVLITDRLPPMIHRQATAEHAEHIVRVMTAHDAVCQADFCLTVSSPLLCMAKSLWRRGTSAPSADAY